MTEWMSGRRVVNVLLEGWVMSFICRRSFGEGSWIASLFPFSVGPPIPLACGFPLPSGGGGVREGIGAELGAGAGPDIFDFKGMERE